MSFTEDDLFKQMKGEKGDKPNRENREENTGSTKLDKFGFNYYKILDVDKDTSISDIKKRYRKLLAKYHPDKFTSLTDKERKLKEKQFQEFLSNLVIRKRDMNVIIKLLIIVFLLCFINIQIFFI